MDDHLHHVIVEGGSVHDLARQVMEGVFPTGDRVDVEALLNGLDPPIGPAGFQGSGTEA